MFHRWFKCTTASGVPLAIAALILPLCTPVNEKPTEACNGASAIYLTWKDQLTCKMWSRQGTNVASSHIPLNASIVPYQRGLLIVCQPRTISCFVPNGSKSEHRRLKPWPDCSGGVRNMAGIHRRQMRCVVDRKVNQMQRVIEMWRLVASQTDPSKIANKVAEMGTFSIKQTQIICKSLQRKIGRTWPEHLEDVSTLRTF